MKKITGFVKFVVVMISSIIMSVGLQSCAEESTNLEGGLISTESFVVEYNHVKYSLDPVKKGSDCHRIYLGNCRYLQ